MNDSNSASLKIEKLLNEKFINISNILFVLVQKEMIQNKQKLL